MDFRANPSFYMQVKKHSVFLYTTWRVL
ncbi:hypothetical protein LINPERHAP1_LOCUS17911 [Linum perenne]